MQHVSLSLTRRRFSFALPLLAALLSFVPLVGWGQVVISQVYGAGGNSGAAYNRDYVELFNRGAASVTMTNWTIQYASAAGTSITGTSTAFSGTIAPGKYFLVQLTNTGATGAALPTPDFTSAVNVDMSGTTGKVALANNSTAVTPLSATSGSAAPTSTNVVDFVGFGTATNSEGGSPAPAPSATNAIFRAGSGCTETNVNSADFTAAAAAPRNSSTTAAPCTPTPTITTTGTLSAFSTTAGTPSATQTYTVSGAGLTANLTVGLLAGYEFSSTGGAPYTASLSFTPSSGTVTTKTITVRLDGTGSGTVSGNIANASTGATTKNVAATGTVTAAGTPTINVSTNGPLTFNALTGSVSTAQSYTVGGTDLTTDITITAPTGYEVSKTNATTGFAGSQALTPTTGTVATTTIYVRLTNTAVGTPSGNVTNGSTGATTQNVAVTGTVVAEPTTAPTVTAGTPGTTTVTLTLSGGNGTNRLVVVRPALATAVPPTDQTTYAANLAYGTVATNSTTGTNNFVISVAANATTSLNVTGLASGVNYVADVYAFNGGSVAGFENYYTTSGTPAAFTTTTGPCLSGGDFESVTFPPTGWAVSTVAAATRSTTAADVAVGTAAALMNATGTSSFTTAPIANPQAIAFYLGTSSNASTARRMDIRVSTDNATYTTIKTYWTVTSTGTSPEELVPSTYLQKTVDLSAYNSFPQVWVRFERTCSSSVVHRLDEVTATCGPLGPNTTVGTIMGSPFCVPAAGTAISVPFTVTNGPFTGGNVFTAVLSNASGSFASGTTSLGTLAGTTSGTISGTIPTGVAAGTGYRVRVQGSSPVAAGVSSTTDLTVRVAPTNYTVSITGTLTQTFATNGAGSALAADVPPASFTPTGAYDGVTVQWKYGTTPGTYPTNISGQTAVSYSPNGSDFPGVGTYYVAVVVTADCGGLVRTSTNEAVFTITAPAPVLVVKQGATTFTSGGRAYSFGTVAQGATSSAVTFTIQNTGTANLTVTTPLGQTGDFAVTSQPASPVAASGSTTFLVTFTPTALGVRTGTVVISSNDPTTPTFTLNLTGSGAPSNLSDVITSASVTYNTTGIDYASKQGATVTAANNTLNEVVYRITVRDGGGAADADNLATILDGLTLNITQGATSIRAAALFTSSNGLAGQGVVSGSTITFSNLISTLGASVSRVTAADNGSFDLILRVTFTATATDGQQLRFTVANASAVAGGANTSSTFLTTGAATSITTAGSNELNVIATKLVYSPAVVTTGVVNSDFGVTVVAQDALNNQDTDFKNLAGVVSVPSVSLTLAASTGTGTFTSVLNPALTKTLTGGTAVWTDVRYDVVENGVGLLTTNTGGLTNASTTINFVLFGGHLWVGASGGSWYVASNWSKNTVPTATDDVRLDNSSVNGSYSVSIATPNSVGGTALARMLQVGYIGNPNIITLNITGGGGSVDDNLRVGPAGGVAVLIADGGVVSNSANASGAGNTGLDFASSTDTWQMTGTGTYIHNQTAGVFPTLGTGKATFAATSLFEVKNTSITSNWLLSGLGKIKTYGNLKLTAPAVTVNLNNGLAGTASVGDSLTVLGDLTMLLGTVRVALVNGSTEKERIRVKGNLVVNGGSLYVADGATDSFNQIAVEGDVTTQGTGLIAGGLNSADKGRFVIGGSFTGIYNSGTNTTTGVDELVFQGGTAPVSTFTHTSGTLRFLTIKKSVKLGAAVATNKDIIVASTGTLDFNFFNTSGSGPFTLQAGGTLKITDPAGITLAAATPTGNVRGTGVRTFPNGTSTPLLPTTYWYTGTMAQMTGTGLITTSGIKNIICDNPTTLTLTDPLASYGTAPEVRIQSPGRLDIKQGILIETTTAEVTGSGALTMSGGTYRMVKGVVSGNPTTHLPQLSGTYTISGGALELAGTGNQSLTARNVYNKLRFKNSGVKTLTNGIGTLPDSVVIGGAAILDLTKNSAGTVGTVGLTGAGGLLMTGTSRLITSLVTGPAPGMQGEYTLPGGTIEFTGSSPTNTQTIRGNELLPLVINRTYHNIEVTGTNVGMSTGNFAIASGGTMTVKTGASFSMEDQSISGAGSFVLETGSTFKYGSPQGIRLLATGGTGTSGGNIRVSGTRTFVTTASYVLQGVGASVTGDGLPATVAGLTVNKGSAANIVTLTSPVAVSSNLTLTSGLLAIGNNDVTLAPAATLTGGSAASYIRTDVSPTATGKLVRTVANNATDVLFPVGTSTYTPAKLQQTVAGAPDNFGVRVFDGARPGGLTGTPVTADVVSRTWDVTEATAGGANATLTVQWNTADEATSFNRDSSTVVHFEGGAWNNLLGDYAPATAVAANVWARSRTGLTAFSPFSVQDYQQVLPVELTRFAAAVTPKRTVALTWATASEQNADRFEVQRSRNGRTYETIGSVAAAGTSSMGHDYSFVDAQPFAGLSYYRLRQVDTDGAAQFSQEATVTLNGAAIVAALSSYPQPFAADLNLTIATPAGGTATVDVIDLSGRQVLRHSLPVVVGTTTLALPGAHRLAPGAYVVRVTLPDGAVLRTRIVKE